MVELPVRKAIIVGASSGIGKALAELLSSKGYIVGLVARRTAMLLNIQKELPSRTYIRTLDIRDSAAVQQGLTDLIADMGDVDLVVISAGIGHVNPELSMEKEMETIATNVSGFTAVANVVFHYFLQQGSGHLVGISSIAAIRGNADAPAYNASKAFVSNYLEGLRQKSARLGLPICITEIQPGFVDTDMAKGKGLFWVTPVRKAAAQIYRAIESKRAHTYVSKRWRLVGWLLKGIPSTLYRRM